MSGVLGLEPELVGHVCVCGQDSKFHLQLQSRRGSIYNCLSRSPRTILHVAGALSKQGIDSSRGNASKEQIATEVQQTRNRQQQVWQARNSSRGKASTKQTATGDNKQEIDRSRSVPSKK